MNFGPESNGGTTMGHRDPPILMPRTVASTKIALPRLTPEARRYALKELARRAGVSRHDFATWKVESSSSETVAVIGGSPSKRISFAHQTDPFEAGHLAGKLPVCLLKETTQTMGELIALPFLKPDLLPGAPLFEFRQDGSLHCRHDLLASFLLTLSRYEEILSPARDEHGRFLAASSMAMAHNFLERPILDEIGLLFEMALGEFLPGWIPAPRRLRMKLSHDIDAIGLPFRVSSAVGHSLKRRKPSATLHDIASRLGTGDPAELRLVRQLAHISRSRGFQSAFYWKASQTTPHDTGYDPCYPGVQKVIQELQHSGFELGVHPGYQTFQDRQALAAEVERLKSALGVNSPGGRQHYLRWSPDSWLDWESCGLSYDSSVGYAEHFGFRAGTSYPYRPWSFSENRELDLLEIPLILMDCTPVKYMALTKEQAFPRILKMIERTAKVGGVFTLLWHNTPLLDPAYKGWYESILDMLADAQQLSLPPRPSQFW